jgi:hypothetical protein
LADAAIVLPELLRVVERDVAEVSRQQQVIARLEEIEGRSEELD